MCVRVCVYVYVCVCSHRAHHDVALSTITTTKTKKKLSGFSFLYFIRDEITFIEGAGLLLLLLLLKPTADHPPHRRISHICC